MGDQMNAPEALFHSLPQRLRAWAGGDQNTSPDALLYEAADGIERLRERLADTETEKIERGTEILRLRESIRHVCDDSPGTPDSVKRFLAAAVLTARESSSGV